CGRNTRLRFRNQRGCGKDRAERGPLPLQSRVRRRRRGLRAIRAPTHHRRREPMTPLVSVSICSFNHLRYLPAAIESALGQTLDDIELIVVDDGSSDGSLAVVEQYAAADSRVGVVTHPRHANLGPAASGNLARSLARGKYQIGLSSDDVLYPDALEREVDLLERRPALGIVYGYA